MALIAMAVYSTDDNRKDKYLESTLNSLFDSVLFKNHRLMLSVNGFTEKTGRIIKAYSSLIEKVIYNDSNLGTAGAINKVIKERNPGEHVIKCDDDWVTDYNGWADEMEAAIERDSRIGIIGLKRKDLVQTTWNPDKNYRSELVMLPHDPGQRWIQVERTPDIIGTCTMFNSALLDKVGYSRQPGKYGFEDNLMCHRSHLAGFYNCFLNHIPIDHIDEGAPQYQEWKAKHSGEHFKEYQKIVLDMIAGREPIYYNPFL